LDIFDSIVLPAMDLIDGLIDDSDAQETQIRLRNFVYIHIANHT